uniref:Uncharacterized protein n=2 Tax=Cacopsylla melanoneura TaxID=428564 RepID=A0A8D9EGA6_9HEMI
MSKPSEEQEKTKMVKNAVKVIGNALSGSSDNLADKKSSTLPRRKSKADFVQPAPFIVPMPNKTTPEFRSEIRHMVNSPPAVTQRTEVTFPVSAPPPASTPPAKQSVTRQGNQSREHIIPIKFEPDVVTTSPTQQTTSTTAQSSVPLRKSSSQQSQHNISRTSSRSLSRQSTCDSDSSICSSGDPIRKSAREVIIPIAVEGGGFITPSSTALNRINSITESEDEGSASGSHAPRCFTLRSTRRRVPSQASNSGLHSTNSKSMLEPADSVSSDEDDDNFEILTAENLFSTLLSRVRSLTQRLNTDEHRSAFPRSLFHHGSIFDNPATRLSETRSFNRADSIHPWRRSLSREPLSGGSASTLPRDRSKSSNRNTMNSSQQGTISSREDNSSSSSPYRSRLRPPITIKNTLSKQLMKERLNELDGIDKPTETKLKSRHNAKHNEFLVDSDGKDSQSEPYVYKMRTRQRTNATEAASELANPSVYQMRTRNRSNSSEVVNETRELATARTKRPISIHESLDSNSPVARRIYQRSFSCDRNKVNAVLKDSAKILETNVSEATPSPINSFRRTNSLRQPTTSFDKKKEYRRSLSTNTPSYGETSVLEKYLPTSNSSLERILSPTRKVSRFLRSSMYEPSEPNAMNRSMRESSVGLDSSSRIKSTIRSLRESSVGPESSIDSESNLIKRAISLESKNSTEPRSSVYRTQSLKQNSTSNNNVYKDFISKIVNSRDGNVSRSIFNEKNSSRLKYEPSHTSLKFEGYKMNNIQRNASFENKVDGENSNNTENAADATASRISRLLRSSENNMNSGIKPPSRLTPNSEPLLLRNRRYSIPRSSGMSKDVTTKHETDSGKIVNSKHETSPIETNREDIQVNGHAVETESGTQNENNVNTKDDKHDDNSLEKVEKVITNLEKAQKSNRTESISKLKRLDLTKIHPRETVKQERASTSRSLDHCDNSSRCSFLSPTEDSDGWSICSDVTDIRGDCPSPSSPSSAHEETVSERIRRKSFFSRFNPRKESAGDQIQNSRTKSYTRSASSDNPSAASQQRFLKSTKSLLKTRERK